MASVLQWARYGWRMTVAAYHQRALIKWISFLWENFAESLCSYLFCIFMSGKTYLWKLTHILSEVEIVQGCHDLNQYLIPDCAAIVNAYADFHCHCCGSDFAIFAKCSVTKYDAYTCWACMEFCRLHKKP